MLTGQASLIEKHTPVEEPMSKPTRWPWAHSLTSRAAVLLHKNLSMGPQTSMAKFSCIPDAGVRSTDDLPGLTGQPA